MRIRLAEESDLDAIWHIFHAVVSSGDTYAFDPATPREAALSVWCSPDVRTYVADDAGVIVGTYILKPNQPGLGSHVANAAFMVAPHARGRGVGQAMAEHSLIEARRLGYRAMQFNLVVANNKPAVALWKKLGFETVGVLPDAFRHARDGYVDALVMYRRL